MYEWLQQQSFGPELICLMGGVIAAFMMALLRSFSLNRKTVCMKLADSLMLSMFMLSLLIITLMGVALTYGRYTEETSSSGGSYGSDIEYIVANQIEVRNVNEFIGAIQNGYTNITVADQAEALQKLSVRVY